MERRYCLLCFLPITADAPSPLQDTLAIEGAIVFLTSQSEKFTTHITKKIIRLATTYLRSHKITSTPPASPAYYQTFVHLFRWYVSCSHSPALWSILSYLAFVMLGHVVWCLEQEHVTWSLSLAILCFPLWFNSKLSCSLSSALLPTHKLDRAVMFPSKPLSHRYLCVSHCRRHK